MPTALISVFVCLEAGGTAGSVWCQNFPHRNPVLKLYSISITVQSEGSSPKMSDRLSVKCQTKPRFQISASHSCIMTSEPGLSLRSDLIQWCDEMLWGCAVRKSRLTQQLCDVKLRNSLCQCLR